MFNKKFLNEQDQRLVINAISVAEKRTSGEIRVHIESKCKIDVLDRAVEVFHQLNMQNTKDRNGILFYLAHESRKFAILGDKGINEALPVGFWDDIKTMMMHEFAKKNFTEGLCMGIQAAGEKLTEYFPLESDDKNELSDEISFGN